ncbi:MAG: hypothetical protein K2W85_14705 [Phycisphaerales bacterium]|nr:hypothetical protein [Phycisphaerales bacterium]
MFARPSAILRALFSGSDRSVTSKPKRPRQSSAHAFGLEAMESRQLFNSDLAISWDLDNFRFPAVIVPGDRFNPDGGSTRIETPLLVLNNGPLSANGTVNIEFYLSTDTNLSPGTDTLLRRYTGEPLFLNRFTGDPDDIGVFSPDMLVPADTAPGTYFLIARLVASNNNILDTNPSNNIAVSANAVNVQRRFGSFSGRNNVTMTLLDPEGTRVSFAMSGGGFGDVTTSPDGFSVTLTGSGNASIVQVTNTGGDGRYDFVGVAVNGSIGTFSAPNARLRGPLTATTGFGNITLGDVLGPRTITVPNTSTSPSFNFNNVTNLIIDSAVGITSVTARSWDDTDSTRDIIAAPFLEALTFISGNLDLDLRLSGRSGGSLPTLGPVNINGVIKQALWLVNGSVTSINAFATTVNFFANIKGNISSISTVQTLRAKIAARSIGTITSGRDILASRIYSGADLGDDARFGGTGANADTFNPGSITSIIVARNTANTIIGAGFDPVDAVPRNGNDRILGGTTSRIGAITVGNISGLQSRFLAGAYDGPITFGGVNIDWRSSSRFELSTTGPRVGSFSVIRSSTGTGQSVADITITLDSTSVMSFASILTGTLRITGPGGFDAIASLTSKSFAPSSNSAAATAVFRVLLADTAVIPLPGQYDIAITTNTAADDRGNFAIPGIFGNFNVA